MKPKKRGCLRWLVRGFLVVLLLLSVTLLWLNGPGFRWLAAKYGPGLLEKAGFEGEFEISGTLWKGPVIESISLSSETSPLKSLKATNLRLEYDPFALRNLEIDSLTADTLSVDLDLSQSQPKKEEESKEPGPPLAETLAKYRAIAMRPEIAIRDLDLHVHKGETNFYQLEDASLAHAPGSDRFEIDPGTLTDFENRTSDPEIAAIRWLPDQFQISAFPAARDVIINDLAARYTPDLGAVGSIRLFDSTLDIDSDGRSYAKLDLKEAPLDLEPFFRFIPNPPPLKAKLTSLTGVVEGFDKPFSQWTADLAVGLESNEWRARSFPDLSMTIAKDALAAISDVRLSLPGEPLEVHIETDLPPDLIDEPGTAWQKIATTFDAGLPSLETLLTALAPHLNLPEPESGWPDSAVRLDGNLQPAPGGLGPTVARLRLDDLHWSQARFPLGTLDLEYTGHDDPIRANLLLRQDPDSTLGATAVFDRATQTYEASLTAEDFMAESLQPFIALAKPDLNLAGTISLIWNGTGNLADKNSHRGDLSLTQTRLVVNEQPPVTIDISASYDGLNKAEVPQFTLAQTDQIFSGNLSWDGTRLILPSFGLRKAGQLILSGEASLPLEPGKLGVEEYLSQTDPWILKLNADRLDIPSTVALFALPVPEGLGGTLTVDTTLTGSPSEPSFSGRLRLDEARYNEVEQLPPTDVSLSWATAGESFSLGGTITPRDRDPIAISASTGFRPREWAENPDRFLEESFALRANAPSVDLAEFAALSPVVKSITGTAMLDVTANGTFRSPVIEGSLEVDVPRVNLDLPRFNRIRETSLRARFADQTVTILPSSLSSEGGLFEIEGIIGLEDTKNPVISLDLSAKSALIWRDDSVNSRADANVSVRGTLQSARVNLDLGLVESLFYKDIELLPVGVPVSVPKAPSLPSLGRPSKGSSTRLPLPEPFASWTLAGRAITKDPFLIRGNLTEGQVNGSIQAGGTLGQPSLTGSLVIQDFVANLPFSTLTIENGRANFTPAGGFIPDLDILAESEISPYQVDLFVFGKATSPQISFASSPPLPENEIITLLATGVTPEGLEDTDTARNKLFQLLIERIRRAPPGTYTHKFLRPLAEPLKDVQFQVAGADPFTGKKRNSVTVPIPELDGYYVSAAVDSENNTRLLLRYVFEFGGPDNQRAGPPPSPRTPPADGGGRTRVRILGLSGLTEEEVLNRLAGRLDFVTSRPPDRASADDADFLVRRLLEKEGYPEVDLKWRIPADRLSIELTVNAGTRYTIGNVTFPGAPAGTEEDMALYFTGSKAIGKNEAPYIASKVEEAVDNANNYLRSLGYWKSSISYAEPELNPADRTVDMALPTAPGPLHVIASIRIEGPVPDDAPRLVDLVNENVGKPATAANLRRVREGAAGRLRNRGYQFAETFLTAEHEGGRSRLTLIVDPGRKYRLRRALITGVDNYDLERVQKRLDRRIGEPYDQDAIDRVQKTLQSTGAFHSVRAERETNREDGTITTTLHLEEGKPQGVSLNLGAGSFEGFIVGASYYNRNFLGKLYNLNAAAEYSGIGFLGEVSVSDPFFLGFDLRATPRAFILSRTYDEYSKLESGLGFTLSYDLNPKNKLEFDALISFATVTSEGLPEEALGVSDYLVTTLGATWIHDDRDSPVTPGEGFYSRVRAEFGGVGAQEPNLFFRLEGQASYHWPISDKSKLAFNLRTGLLAPLDDGVFPVDLRYFIGGADSVRSFPARQLGPKAGGVPRGGQAFWYGNIEYVRQLAGVLYGVAFFDAGSLDESSLNWPSFDPMMAVGAGVRLDLPIGPIRFEYGHALNPKPEDPSGAFHFSIGASF